MRGYRKFAVAMAVVLGAVAIGLTQSADVLVAFGGAIGIPVGAYMGAHAMQDSKWSKGS